MVLNHFTCKQSAYATDHTNRPNQQIWPKHLKPTNCLQYILEIWGVTDLKIQVTQHKFVPTIPTKAMFKSQRKTLAPGDALSSCCKLVLLGPKEASLPFINSMLCYIMLPYRRRIGSTFWQLHIATDHANLWWMVPTTLCSKFIQVQQGHPSHLKGWSTNLSHRFKIIDRSFCVESW